MSELNAQLWASADILRGKMDASEYKNYLLGLVFYKYLSDQQLRAVYEEEHGKVESYPARQDQFSVFDDWYNEDAADVKQIISGKLGYFIEPEYLVVMNPPYSANWSADEKFLSDPRFERYVKLAPKSKADFAFLLHGFYHLNEQGTMGIVLPRGVLFRGSAEGVIRKTLLEMGAIDAVIGLPQNIFYGTNIPTVVLILKKNRENNGRDLLFIDASNDFEKQKETEFVAMLDELAVNDETKDMIEVTKRIFMQEGQR